MHRIIAAAGAFALLTAASSAGAQQPWEVNAHLSEAFGTYQCGPNRITIDASWQFSPRLWDGIHYWIDKRQPDDIYFVFGFPILSQGGAERFARGDADRFELRRIARMTDYGAWVCSRV